MSDKYKDLEGIAEVQTIEKGEDYVQLKIACATACIKSLAAAHIISKADTVEFEGRTYKASRPLWETEDDTTIIIQYTAIS